MRRAAAGVLTVGSVVILFSLAQGGPLAERFFVFTSLLFPGALIALAERQRSARLRVVLPLALTLVLEASAAVVIFQLGGRPGTLLAMALGLGVIPLLLLPGLHVILFRPVETDRPAARDA